LTAATDGGISRGDATHRSRRLAGVALVLVSLLPALPAAWPTQSYYFRDFGLTFLPQRLLAAAEWRAGRFPQWNPYLHEGTFVIPALYPGDLLHALWPTPAAVSWLLTLHFPLAAVFGYRLARRLGAERPGAFVSGAVYAMGGLALSSLNLYVFLQALALAPGLVAALPRAAQAGGRSVVAAAVLWGLLLSTLALEFAVQAALLGAAIGLLAGRSSLPRIAAALLLGAGLAAVPIAVVTGILPETARGSGLGFTVEDALAGETPPLALLQSFVFGLLGYPAAPLDMWWGAPLFRAGFPYFLTLYVGPLVLALAAAGVTAVRPHVRAILLGAAALALWFSIGESGGLAAWVLSWPGLRFFRFPSKALLTVHLVVAMLAGIGFDRLRSGRGWPSFARACALLSALAFAIAALVAAAPEAVAERLGVGAALVSSVRPVVAAEAAQAGLLAGLGILLAWAARRGSVAPSRALPLLAGAVVIDLVRAGAGVNPQTRPDAYRLLPEVEAHVTAGGRVFSYSLEHSPAFRAYRRAIRTGTSFQAFYLNRQLLAPYLNVLDRVESAETPDLTSFGPALPELPPADHHPSAIARIVARLRHASVSRILSLDVLEHPDVRLLASVPAGRTGLQLRVYELRQPWPRAHVACRLWPAQSQAGAFAAPLGAGFDPERDAAVEEPLRIACSAGRVRPTERSLDGERYEVETDGAALLVIRGTFASGWTASVNGRAERVLRANGKHRAVLVEAGRHEVVFAYEPPRLLAGLVLFALASVAAVALWIAGGRSAPRPSGETQRRGDGDPEGRHQ
jgi:hypothetical protein